MARSSRLGFTITAEAGRTTIRPLDWLRFCPVCVKSERRETGECFWHRIHHAPGVEVCPKHAVFLENSSVRARFTETSDWYAPAEEVVSITTIRPLTSTDSFHQILMRWASNVAWLLDQHILKPNNADLYNVYLSGLVEKGIVKRTGSIRKVREGTLVESLNDYFPPAFLALYEPNKGGTCKKPYQSIKRLLRGNYAHPAHHLILIEFLGHTAKSFFEMLSFSNSHNNHKPFGDGPWPCLNPASAHFRQLMVDSCRSMKSDSNKGTLVGFFACAHCGFIYRRVGPDKSPDDRLRYSTIKVFGLVWEETLTKLWHDTSISTNKIAKRLGIRNRTIVRQAMRLGLSFPRLGPLSSVTNQDIFQVENIARREAERLAQLRTYRNAWLSEQKKNPKITRTELASRLRRVYSWLYLHDHEWLEAHKPPPNYSRVNHRIDWETRDSQLSEEVRREASQLKMMTGRPARVTRALIAKNLKKVNQLSEKALLHLPRTTQAFSEVVDSPVEFLTRRGSVDILRKMGRTKTQLQKIDVVSQAQEHSLPALRLIGSTGGLRRQLPLDDREDALDLRS